jgi:hypothetical protein
MATPDALIAATIVAVWAVVVIWDLFIGPRRDERRAARSEGD